MQNLEIKSQNLHPKFKSDLKHRCYNFSIDLIVFINTLPNQRSVWIISDQVLRSGTSIGANLFEATAASSRLEFKKFHEIALKSANETIYWLNLLKDTKKANSEQVDPLLQEVTELAKMIAAGVVRLKEKL